MDYDAQHAALLLQPYRYVLRSNAAVLDLSDNAKQLSYDTNLNEADATALATSLATRFGGFDKPFSFVIRDVLFLEDFCVQPNRYRCSFSQHPNSANAVYTTASAEIDWENNVAKLTVAR